MLSASWLLSLPLLPQCTCVTRTSTHIGRKLPPAKLVVSGGRRAVTTRAAASEFSSERTPSRPSMVNGIFGRKGTPATLVHLAVFSQAGVVVRILLGELFGGNCAERVRGGNFHWIPCVVADGTGDNHGGAFFRDLPANAVGCFVMGLLSSVAVLAARYSAAKEVPEKPIAAFKRGSPLQSHDALQVGLRTGFCGSLTTFASWQLQMMVMLFGGAPTQLDSQWLGVLSGLVVGTQVALASLTLGEHAGLALMGKETPHSGAITETKSKKLASDMEGSGSNVAAPNSGRWSEWSAISCTAMVVLVISTAASLMGTFSLKGGGFWKKLCVAVLFGPLGAILRWRLGAVNGKMKGGLSWFPAGTFAANMIACAVSFLAHGVSVYSSPLSPVQAVMVFALKTGFAGSLSTVSTWAVEVRKMMGNVGKDYHGYKYILTSHLGALLIGVIAYGWAVWL
ncbi:hypothetical protein BSKO_10098 [Bryopsis sp. KO-2023]|nr:hypothetical protein BSKO_10098 [Bryopsis sp. KO-2023]